MNRAGRGRQIAAPIGASIAGAVAVAALTLAASGSQAAFPPSENGQIAYSAGGSKVFVISPVGDNPSNITANLGNINDGPAYSPAGNKIALSSAASGNRDIWLMNADGSFPVDLTIGNNTPDSAPAFSPDGKHIAYTSRQGGDTDVMLMQANGATPVNLTPAAPETTVHRPSRPTAPASPSPASRGETRT